MLSSAITQFLNGRQGAIEKSTNKSFPSSGVCVNFHIIKAKKLGEMDWKQILSLSNEDLNDERKEEIYVELIKDQKFDGKIAKKLFP